MGPGLRRLIPAVLLLLCLAGCGGGGGNDPGVPPPSPPPPSPPPSPPPPPPPPPAGDTITLSGTVRFERVPFRALPAIGLDYANPVLRPARGVGIRALAAGTQSVLATGQTSASGAYSLQVPQGSSVVLQVIAQMAQGSAQSAPRWDVRVQDGLNAGAPYSYSSAAFDSSSGGQDLRIPTGISAQGSATGPRASGPFAILDTVYTGIQAVLQAQPDAAMPPLLVDWGSHERGSVFSAQAGRQSIALNWDLTEDTEEFDPHVIAHEFGHFIEYNFSRSDSIGGAHGLGDRLDPRVAFGEGFGYAFAAIVLNDPVLRDSFVNNGTQTEGRISVETNPSGSVTANNGGCWCSESSVWSLLWDLHDTTNEGVDTLSLGFQPIWDAMRGAHRTTPAVTSIFSFINALKAAQPQHAAAIDALLAAQNIDVVIDDFATGETHAPFAGVLPLYTNIVPGAPVVLRNVDDAGRHNKLGNHRFLRFAPGSSGLVTVTLATSNPDPDADPDFIVRRNGVLAVVAQDPPPGNESAAFNASAGQSYIIDAYDCANGCQNEEGIPGDYDLTVTIQ